MNVELSISWSYSLMNLRASYIYLGLSLLPCLHAFYSIPNLDDCKPLKNFLTSSSSFLLVQLPYWSCLPFVISSQMSNYRSIPIATFSFLSELPYFIVGGLFTYDGLQIFQIVEPETMQNITETCNSQVITFYTVFVLFVTTLAFGAIWLMSVPYFVDTVYPAASARAGFGLVSILTSILLLGGNAFAIVLMNKLETCKNPINAWVFASTISVGLFFLLYFLAVSTENTLINETTTRYISNFLLGGFMPFNMFWFMKGLAWIAEEFDVSDTEQQICIQETSPLFAFVLIYHTIICYILFSVIIATYAAVTSNISPDNILRPFQITSQQGPVYQLNFFIQPQQSQPQQNIELVEKLKNKEFNSRDHTQSFNEKTVCPICMEGFSSGQMVIYLNPCRHIFHDGCIKHWILKNSSCPSCRRQITPEIVEQP